MKLTEIFKYGEILIKDKQRGVAFYSNGKNILVGVCNGKKAQGKDR